MKKALLRLYYFGNNKKEDIDKLQANIRNVEWASIVDYIPANSTFLDIGCGAGYSMQLALAERNCKVFGIDPEPNAHGVGRNWDNIENFESKMNIEQGSGEALPYTNNSFEVVYSSHVLEHVNNELKFLQEAKRVVKDDGVIIIGVPTASMAFINLISQLIFTSHHRIVNFIFSRLGMSSFPKVSLKHLLFLYSHSFSDKTIFYDLKHYKVENWRNLISKELIITDTILPAIYPYPDFIQFFKLRKNKKYSSSVFFICKKK